MAISFRNLGVNRAWKGSAPEKVAPKNIINEMK